MIRIGSALFNADHARLGEELRHTEAAGVDFFHLDVFDGYFVRDQAFSARTVKTLRQLTQLPFEIHLAVKEPERFLPALKEAGADLVFLPAESTLLLYETIYSARELGMKTGLCLALGTPLHLLEAALPMIDSVLLLGRVTGEGKRGRDFNQLVVERVRAARRMIDERGLKVDLQAAGGLETANCVEVVQAGATSLPLGGALHHEPDLAAYVTMLRGKIEKAAGADARRLISPIPAHSRPVTSQPSHVGAYKVLVASRSFGKNCPETLERMKAAGCVFLPHAFEKAPSETELLKVIGDADVVVSGTEPITAKVLAAAPRLKVIAKHGVGYENIDVDAAKTRGIPVALAGPVMTDAVADLAFSLLLSLARQIPQANAAVKSGQWPRLVGSELRGKILGIVGLGQIGKAVARRAKAFGLELLAHDTFEDTAFSASWAVRYVSLDELLKNSDFVSLHAPVIAQTKHMMNAERLAAMKATAFLINTSRGELVDEAALFEALKAKRLAGAASDVFAKEPPGDHPLLKLDNFIATPHLAGQTPEALQRMGENTGENVLRVLRGERPLFTVE